MLTSNVINLKKIKNLRIAKEVGYRDYWEYVPRRDNPYKIDALRNAWEEGWHEAEIELIEFSSDFPERYTNNVVPFVKA